jgi:hypothetical protein
MQLIGWLWFVLFSQRVPAVQGGTPWTATNSIQQLRDLFQ